MTDQDLTREACRVVNLGKEKGIALRVMGATAFRIHCPKYADLHSKLRRELSDLDFATIGKQKESVFGVIREAVYQNGPEIGIRYEDVRPVQVSECDQWLDPRRVL